MENSIEWELSIVLLVAVNSEAEIVRERLRELSTDSNGAVKDDGNCTIYYIKINDVLLKIIYSKCPYPNQGGDSAAWQTTLLIKQYDPYCLIMLGKCAGNRNEQLGIGDVIISGTVFRHDYGKLSTSENKQVFEARGTTCCIKANDKLIEKIQVNCLRNYGNSISSDIDTKYKIKIGAISSGCQLVKYANAHSIISKYLHIGAAAGDEHNRVLLGIDMEAYAVAYASEKSNCKWLVIKGVSDFAEPTSNIDDGSKKAVTNSFSTAILVIREVIISLFLQESGEETISKDEGSALVAYRSGEFEKEKCIAKEAFQKGMRSVKIRRRLLHGLVETDRFDEADQICNYLKDTNLLYDGNTAEYEMQMLSRKGEYLDALKIVTNFMRKNDATIQMLYIGATSSYQIAEKSTAKLSDVIRKKEFIGSMDLIEKAVERMENDGKQMPWLYIFSYFLYAIDNKYNENGGNNKAVGMKNNAESMLKHMTTDYPNLATTWFHRLLLYAITNEEENFNRYISGRQGKSLSWTRLDSAYARLNSFRKHSILDETQFSHYWKGLSKWVAEMAPRYSKPAQQVTNSRLPFDNVIRPQ